MSNASTEDAQLAYYSFGRSEMAGFIAPTCKRLLDVGCGAGSFGETLKQGRDLEVWGVEPHESAAATARVKLDRVIVSPFTADLNIPQHHFDAIVFNDSLEHFPDPYPPLAAAKRFLSGDGVVIASIPNVRYIDNVRHFLVEMDWKYEESGIRDRTHLRFFTRKSILRTFDEAGYDIERIEGINSHYWSGKKIYLMRFLFGRWIEDMRYLQFAVVARPRESKAPSH